MAKTDKCFYDEIKGLNDYIEALEEKNAQLEDKIEELEKESDKPKIHDYIKENNENFNE